MTPILLILMLVASAVMVYGLVGRRGGKKWGKAVAVAGAVVALVSMCGLVVIAYSLRHGHPRTGDHGEALGRVKAVGRAYVRIAGIKLGRYLGAKCPGAKALIVVYPQLPGLPPLDNSLLDGLKEGWGQAITIVGEVSPEIPKVEPPAVPSGLGATANTKSSPTHYEDWMTPSGFDKMLVRYAGKYDMIITTVGLPPRVDELQLWQMHPPAKVVLGCWPVWDCRKKIEFGAIVAAVTDNPHPKGYFEKPPADLDTAFNKRYLLITPDNVAQMAKEYPELFAAEKVPAAKPENGHVQPATGSSP